MDYGFTLGALALKPSDFCNVRVNDINIQSCEKLRQAVRKWFMALLFEKPVLLPRYWLFFIYRLVKTRTIS